MAGVHVPGRVLKNRTTWFSGTAIQTGYSVLRGSRGVAGFVRCNFVEGNRTVTPLFGTERILNVDIMLCNSDFENKAV